MVTPSVRKLLLKQLERPHVWGSEKGATMKKTDEKTRDQVRAASTTHSKAEIKVQVQKPCDRKGGSRSIPYYIPPT